MLLLYRDGIIVEEARKIIKSDVYKILEEHTKTVVTNEIIYKIECKTFIDRDELGNADKKLICLNNGVLNIETMELLQHSPNFNFMAKIPVNYDSKATCKRIDDVLLEILSSEYVELIKEWL